MKILQIFNRYAYIGGEEIAVDQITTELDARHDVRTITFDSNEWAKETGFASRVRQFFAMAWNPSSIRTVRNEIAAFQPDLILLHNIMPVGSAWLYVHLAYCGVPVVQFIHNFRPFSVNGYCWGNGTLLPQGIDKNFWPEVKAGAWQNSRLKTAWYALLIRALHHAGVYQRINGWIAVSRFMKDTFVRGGIKEERIRVISHSWQPRIAHDAAAISDKDDETVFLFLGRLTEEKGLRVLLDAWELLESKSNHGRLKIAGDGPLLEEVSARSKRMSRAEFVGFKTGGAKADLLRECAAMVVPSVWWEPLGLVLYEAYDNSKPVLAARSGGIVDHVVDGQTGWLHDPGDFQTLASQMLEVIADRETCRIRGRNGNQLLHQRSRRVWINEFNEFVGAIAQKAQPPQEPATHLAGPTPTPDETITISVYLADQNPGHDRSYGISRMSQVVLDAIHHMGGVRIEAVASRTSQQAPADVDSVRILPWGTRGKWVRLLTDHLHPLFRRSKLHADLHYFPKGYLPFLIGFCRPSVVTIHDTIIQYDEDHYPDWRKPWEYRYWAMMLKHTLRSADRIMTVSKSSKKQIYDFMDRHKIPAKDITVTYEPCLYEAIPQPMEAAKENYVIHLASCEPHKRTIHLVRWWFDAEAMNMSLPTLHLIGTVPTEVEDLLSRARTIVKRPFLENAALLTAYLNARALILPSEIEGFGLPALEAYYLGTPVCFVKGTSVEEILGVATTKGGFSLGSPVSLFSALKEVMEMPPGEIRACGLKLRETYASEKVASRMMEVFWEVKRNPGNEQRMASRH